ncbi:MAG TPA: hypothetical protein VGN61_09545 [Verrucomicrobiae bacterium]
MTGLLVTACAPYTYQGAFKDYSDVYADGQNYQMLLNLARLSQHHPTYFFQSGNIQANYTLSGQLGASGGQAAMNGPSKPPFGWLLSALTFQGTRTSQPTFNFVPLVGGDFASHLVAPLTPDLFNAFFQAGFPVDILMRSLVQRIEFSQGTNQVILNNVPTGENIENFARFLRLCDMLRDLQDRGYLLLTPREASTNSERYNEIRNAEFTGPLNAKDVTEGLSQGYHWVSSDAGKTNRWHLERDPTNTLSFQFTPDAIPYLTNAIEKKELPYIEPEQVTNLMIFLGPNAIQSARVTLRSFLFVLQDMATEQEAFGRLSADANCRKWLDNMVPARQRRPVLAMNWRGSTNELFTPLVSLSYQGKAYQITDRQEPWDPHGDYVSYNRDAFMLACTLFTQISLDPAKLNYQQEYLLTR